MTPQQRAQLIAQYERGPTDLETALLEVPVEARNWHPSPEDCSVHEIVCHCADSETSGYTRIRMLAAEPSPLIVGYDQDRWAVLFDYRNIPLESALAVIRAVRLHTAILLNTLPDETWAKTGQHSESGVYTADDWLRIYGVHLSDHADQIRRVSRQWSDHLDSASSGLC
ncbi:MAG: DinB family protein [Thermomicrobiales bacterium]